MRMKQHGGPFNFLRCNPKRGVFPCCATHIAHLIKFC
jgi:hypothetical protein